MATFGYWKIVYQDYTILMFVSDKIIDDAKNHDDLFAVNYVRSRFMYFKLSDPDEDLDVSAIKMSDCVFTRKRNARYTDFAHKVSRGGKIAS